MRKIRKGDEVIVIAGASKGRRGTVLRVVDGGERLLVEGVNVVKKHTKPNPNAGVQGGIVEQERPIQASNVQIFNPATNAGDRVGIRTLEDGRKVRFFKSNNEVVDV
ncbi:MAG: 50S ribosomal protein L24 [Gammaproteobacteria bacterium]|jgi:large subunit ribosomal protein L24|nr:50S ribosomal protein L24 [Gammaproteobacteria bacterium]